MKAHETAAPLVRGDRLRLASRINAHRSEPIVPLQASDRPSSVRRSVARLAPRAAWARGLTLIEVVVAASILAIAAIAVLELLSSGDRVGLTARRQALAAIEAERALEACAEALKAGQDLPDGKTLQSGMQGEALLGCVLRVSATNRVEDLTIPPAQPKGDMQTVSVNIRLLVATVDSEDGEQLVSLERAVPVEKF